jgi:hypothetical protein
MQHHSLLSDLINDILIETEITVRPITHDRMTMVLTLNAQLMCTPSQWQQADQGDWKAPLRCFNQLIACLGLNTMAAFDQFFATVDVSTQCITP